MGNAVVFLVVGMVLVGVLAAVASHGLIVRDKEQHGSRPPRSVTDDPGLHPTGETWNPTYRRTALSGGGWHGPWPMFRIGVSPEGLSIPVLDARVGRSVASSAGLGRIPVSDVEEIARSGGIFQFGFRLVLADGTLIQLWSPRLPRLLDRSPGLALLVERDQRKWFWYRRSLPPWVSGRAKPEPGGSGPE